VRKSPIAVIGAGPYGLSVAAHLSAQKIEHRIFGRPMQFWSQIARAADERYLKSYCFGTNLSSPRPGFSFADYSRPRGLETFEPCAMGQFADYGHWFQENNVPWVEPVDVTNVERKNDGFAITLEDGERLLADQVVVATGLSCFAYAPSVLENLPAGLHTHTSRIDSFQTFKGRRVAVIGAGQSSLEAGALLREAGAESQVLVREDAVLWHHRVSQNRSLWRRLRSPITGLGTGPKAWVLTHFPGATHYMPDGWRTRFVKNHLPAEGAWWLRERVEDHVPVHCNTAVVGAREEKGRVVLQLRDASNGTERQIEVDHVVSGTGYDINVDRLRFVDAKLRSAIRRVERSARLSASFESSVPGLRFVGPMSAMSFGPLFRFVIGAPYTAQVVAAALATKGMPARAPEVSHVS
jgi:cation diffusion facilitator CzcD-associated flavoprotein CzcO